MVEAAYDVLLAAAAVATLAALWVYASTGWAVPGLIAK